MIQIDLKTFYRIGFWCFLITAICGIFNMRIYWADSSIPSKIASAAGIIFNFALVGLFQYMLNMNDVSKIPDYKSSTQDQIEEEFKKQ